MLDTTATNLSKVIYIFGFIIFQGPNGDPGVCRPSPVLHQLVFFFSYHVQYRQFKILEELPL